MDVVSVLTESLVSTVGDVLPIAGIIFGMQYLVIRRPMPNLKRVLLGFLYVTLGLSLFLLGLDQHCFLLEK